MFVYLFLNIFLAVKNLEILKKKNKADEVLDLFFFFFFSKEIF